MPENSIKGKKYYCSSCGINFYADKEPYQQFSNVYYCPRCVDKYLNFTWGRYPEIRKKNMEEMLYLTKKRREGVIKMSQPIEYKIDYFRVFVETLARERAKSFNYVTCTECRRVILKQDAYEIEGEYYCEACKYYRI